MEGTGNKSHWENVFTTKAADELSWFQTRPKTSLAFLEFFELPLDANIIDIGAGDSHFVDFLIEKGYQNIYVLDISENALIRAKQRLGDQANLVNWIVSDIRDFNPSIKFDFWHDRAAFHFLTTKEDIDKYVAITKATIKKEGYLVLGTFSENGPKKCSGLDIRQYSEVSMAKCFEDDFQPVKCITEDHQTPFNTIQNFLFCAFQKRR